MKITFDVPDHLVKNVGEDFVKYASEEKKLELLTLISKQSDYGSKNISACPVGPVTGIIVRLFDKLSRLSNLTNNFSGAEHESVYDTTHDIANYGTIGSMVVKGVWPE
jgi:hypothetical protein